MTTLYMYLADPTNPRRVVTVARTVDDTSIRLGVAVCHPLNKNPLAKNRGNQFVKKEGRTLAEKRLTESPLVFERIEGEHPSVTALRYLSLLGEVHFVRDIAKEHLKYLD